MVIVLWNPCTVSCAVLKDCLALLFLSSLTCLNSLPLVFPNTISSFSTHSVCPASPLPSCYAPSRCFLSAHWLLFTLRFSILIFTNQYACVIYFSVEHGIAITWVAYFISIFPRSLLPITLIQLMYNEPKVGMFFEFPFDIMYVNISPVLF